MTNIYEKDIISNLALQHASKQEWVKKAEILCEALPYLCKFSGETFVIKFGGSAMGKDNNLKNFAKNVVLLKQIGINSYDEIFADAAEPKTIQEISKHGFNIKPANKDVREGIRCIKGMPLIFHQDSVNLLKEAKNYRWKTDRNGMKLDEPVKFNDHALDAMRYCVFSKLTIPSITWGAI
jgi:hypothetical protein